MAGSLRFVDPLLTGRVEVLHRRLTGLRLRAVGAVYFPVSTVAWLPIGIISLSRHSQRGRGKGNAQDDGKDDSHGEPPIAPRHKTVVKVSLGLYR